MNTRSSPPSTPRPQPSADELRENRHILAITAASGLTFGVVLAVAFELLGWWMESRIGGGRPAAECDDDVSCPEGQVCLSGECLTITAEGPTACGPGDPCGAECECRLPMSCVDQVCTPPDAPPAVCDDPAIQRLMADISSKCAGDFYGCPDTELKKFMIESSTFDELIGKFPDTMTVHFDQGKPPLRGNSWPPPGIKEHYLERLGTARNRKALEEASIILLIARSSASKNTNNDLKFARSRSRAVNHLLGKLADSPAAHAKLSEKIKAVNLGSERLLSANLYNEHYRNSRITWSRSTDVALSKGLTRYDTLPRGQKKWVDSTINQVVFVVPITCALPSAEAAK